MVANFLPADPPTFSEHGHVALQIKGNHESSTMVRTILPDPRGHKV